MTNKNIHNDNKKFEATYEVLKEKKIQQYTNILKVENRNDETQ